MYIPSSFFGSQNACITATTTTTSGTGSVTTGSFVSQSISWSYIQFENTLDPITSSSLNLSFQAKLNMISGSTGRAKLLLVAGGGAGGYGACVLAPSACNSTAAGGGGGGGIVYYDNFPLSSGSYDISIGAGGGNPLNSGIQGRQGGDTTFTYNIPYTPFTSSILTAKGGGKGGYIINDGYGGNSYVAGVSGGSAGGTVVLSNGDGANQIIQACCDGLGGLNGANQGNAASGGIAGASNFQGTGGGGAGTPGAQTNGTTGPYVSAGGNGLPFNLTGTTLYYAAGGGGVRGQGFPVVQSTGSNGNGSSGFGNGGQGQTLSFPQGTTATNGVVIIAWPICTYIPPIIPPEPGTFPSGAAVIYDFGDTLSYSGSGNIVYDISGNSVTGSLIGNPTWTSDNGGVLRLNPASGSQYVAYSGSFTPNASVVTIWKNIDAVYSEDNGLPDATFAYGLKAATIAGSRTYTPIAISNAGIGSTFFSASITPSSITTFHQYASVIASSGGSTIATAYLDGTGSSATQTKTLNRTGTSGSGSVYIGWDSALPYRLSNGYLMGYLQYNRTLTTTELNQIYTAFSGSF